LKNAIEASTERRPVRLWVAAEAEADTRDVVLSIRDEGCGMTTQQYTRDIWRPFRSSKEGGTGLGMPLVRKIVEIDHRGHVEVASEKGVGTTVTIRLPISHRL
jgi:signal transduction histidine kinase